MMMTLYLFVRKNLVLEWNQLSSCYNIYSTPSVFDALSRSRSACPYRGQELDYTPLENLKGVQN